MATSFIIAFVILFFAFPALIGTFVLGCFAAVRAVRADGDYANTLACLALNLCEPLVTFGYIVVLGLVDLSAWYRPRPVSAAADALLWTAPMVVLLMPVIAIGFRNRTYQLHTLLMLAIGGARWTLAWLAGYYLHLPADGDVLLLPLLMLNISMLWLSLFWGAYELLGPLAVPCEGQLERFDQWLSHGRDVE
jgi:hypothetical protein